MVTIAHLSDLHLCGNKHRYNIIASLLEKARQSADYLVLTGDLTDRGDLNSFEELSKLLMPWPPTRVTLVGGNHDLGAFRFGDVIKRTSLRRFQHSSMPGSVWQIGHVAIVAGDSQFRNRSLAFRALGKIDDKSIRAVKELDIRQPSLWAMHHPPIYTDISIFDGLVNSNVVRQTLREKPNCYVLAGHIHQQVDIDRIHVAPSAAFDNNPLRLYRFG